MDDVVVGRAGELGERPRDRRRADDDDPRCGELRLEEDLERAAAEARVVLDDRTLDRVLAIAAPVARHEAQQQRLAGLEHAQRVQPDGRLGADAADEPIDRPVGEHDGGVARANAGRPSRAHDGGDHEGHAVVRQPPDAICHLAVDHDLNDTKPFT